MHRRTQQKKKRTRKEQKKPKEVTLPPPVTIWTVLLESTPLSQQTLVMVEAYFNPPLLCRLFYLLQVDVSTGIAVLSGVHLSGRWVRKVSGLSTLGAAESGLVDGAGGSSGRITTPRIRQPIRDGNATRGLESVYRVLYASMEVSHLGDMDPVESAFLDGGAKLAIDDKVVRAQRRTQLTKLIQEYPLLMEKPGSVPCDWCGRWVAAKDVRRTGSMSEKFGHGARMNRLLEQEGGFCESDEEIPVV